MISKLIHIYKKQQFQPNLLGLLTNPFFISRSALYRNIKRHSKEFSGSILDVGCGQKPYENLFKNATSYIGMDIEISGHDHKNEKIDIFYDGNKFPFPDNHFDSIICNQVLEHVPNPSEILSEINRTLKPNGKLLFTVPHISDEHEQPYDFYRYTSFGLDRLFSENNLQVVEYKRLNNNIALVCTHLWVVYLYKLTKLKYPICSLLLTPFLFMPFIITGFILSFILPNKNDFFLDSFVVCKKRG